MDTKLLVLFALIATSAALKSHWQRTSEENNIYSGDIKFQMTLFQSWECAKACNKYGGHCLAFGFVPSTGLCYGYGDTTTPEYVAGAQLWSRICSLAGYHVEPALDKCIKFSTNYLNWTEASLSCQADGASLLRLDKQEPVTGWRLYNADPYRWIGGRDIGVDDDIDWKWENGVTVDDSQWSPGYPSPEKKCIEIRRSMEGLFTYNCASAQKYICQE